MTRSLGTRVLRVLCAWLLLTGNGPPYNDFIDQETTGLAITPRFEEEERRVFSLCHIAPERITGGAPDLEPPEGATPAEWQEMRCLEIWLLHELAILNDREAAMHIEGEIGTFREAWLTYWRDYYGQSRYYYVIPHEPDDLGMARYLRLLKEWIHEAYEQRDWIGY